MMTNYLQMLSEKEKTKTQTETMALLGLKRASYNKYKYGGSISDKKAMELAEKLGIEPMEIIAYSRALKSNITRQEKIMWTMLGSKYEKERKEKEKEKKRKEI